MVTTKVSKAFAHQFVQNRNMFDFHFVLNKNEFFFQVDVIWHFEFCRSGWWDTVRKSFYVEHFETISEVIYRNDGLASPETAFSSCAWLGVLFCLKEWSKFYREPLSSLAARFKKIKVDQFSAIFF